MKEFPSGNLWWNDQSRTRWYKFRFSHFDWLKHTSNTSIFSTLRCKSFEGNAKNLAFSRLNNSILPCSLQIVLCYHLCKTESFVVDCSCSFKVSFVSYYLKWESKLVQHQIWSLFQLEAICRGLVFFSLSVLAHAPRVSSNLFAELSGAWSSSFPWLLARSLLFLARLFFTLCN